MFLIIYKTVRALGTTLNWILPAGCRGLIFDCDGTLVDSMPLHYHAWVTVLRRHDLEFTKARFYEWAGVPVDEIVRRLVAEKGMTVDAEAIARERDDYFHHMPESALRPMEAVVDIARRYHRQTRRLCARGLSSGLDEKTRTGFVRENLHGLRRTVLAGLETD